MGSRELKKTATRQAMVDAAARLFREKGVQATTMDDIAHAAQTSRTSVFNYFGYKEMILCEIGARYVAEIARTWNRHVGRSPRSALLELADAIAALAAREPDLIAAVAHEMNHTDPERRRRARETMHYPALVEAVLDGLAATGKLRNPSRRPSYARQLLDMTTGALIRVGGDYPLERLRAELHANVDLFLSGALASAGNAGGS